MSYRAQSYSVQKGTYREGGMGGSYCRKENDLENLFILLIADKYFLLDSEGS